ncbi:MULTISPECIES: hypothetical protein [unclassified Bradyrhizobium]|uniref:hypothetical protein n=1 Tax=unclassified Bradyrhizobium TaxID=2631580 RepID=UPI00247960C1|nr:MULTISPECIES: hypothetical protein [unclassified Bradyrhizobium]WGR70266.1 hypothetical protein MTX24_33520 [Bradyrhizobium sp. ISRA426]WGR82325.1 hypothetical protein MTX21_18625 [Bradyrhizobium sp. ISRA430]
MISFRNSGLLLCLLPVLSDCGLYVPQKDPLVQNDIDPRNGMSRQGKIESNIIANIRCEITRGLYRAVNTGNVPWLAGWGTSISLNLTWEETSNVNPGILYTTPIGGSDVFSAGGGVSGSAHSTRNEAITFTLENRELLREAMLTSHASQGLDCSALEDGVTVSSDLKIDEFIYDKASIAGGHEARTRPILYPQFSTFQETLTFVVSVGGDVTPSWKFIRLSVNPGGPFLSGSRTKTSQVIVTLGPLAKPAGPAGAAQLALQAAVQHDAAVAGNATAAAIRSQSR